MYVNLCWYCKNYYLEGNIPFCTCIVETFPTVRYREEFCTNFKLDPRVYIDFEVNEVL